MTLRLQGFPLFHELNEIRCDLHEKTHHTHVSTSQSIVSFMLHKAVALIAIPANVIEVGIGVLGCVLSACTLGAAKVFIFAITLGHIQPTFSTGFVYLGTGVVHGFVNTLGTLMEISDDIGTTLIQGVRVIQRALQHLGFGHIGKYLFLLIMNVGLFIFKRIACGYQTSVKNEYLRNQNITLPLEQSMNKVRIQGSTRPLAHIGLHYALSLPMIPLNIAIAVMTLPICLISAVVFAINVLIKACTNLNLHMPTLTYASTIITCRALLGAATDIITNILDVAILTYKLMDALGLVTVIAKIGELLAYIPRAICS